MGRSSKKQKQKLERRLQDLQERIAEAKRLRDKTAQRIAQGLLPVRAVKRKRRVRKQKRAKDLSMGRGRAPADNVVPLRPVPAAPPAQVSDSALIRMSGSRRRRKGETKPDPAALWPTFPRGAVPSDATMAMDDSLSQTQSWAAGQIFSSAYLEGMVFLGYPALSEMGQRPEYRKLIERYSNEMTRKWIHLKSVSEEQQKKQKAKQKAGVPARLLPPEDPRAQVLDKIDEAAEMAQANASKAKQAEKSDRIKQLTDELDRLKVQGAFRKYVEHDSNFGRAHLYLDLLIPGTDRSASDDPSELMTPIGDGRNEITRGKVTKGSLRRLQNVEPVWCYPQNYNSLNPLQPDWYNPEVWLVNGKRVHVSRLMRLVGREVPDLLKPWYAFGGLPLIQMAKPYVDNFLRTRQSVADLIHKFSTSGLKTNLSSILQGGSADGLMKRMDIFAICRDNNDVMVLDKDTEEWFNVTTPLSTLDALQAQSQEMCASVVNMPLVIYLGVTPQGLNASSEGEIKVWDDWILSCQEAHLREPLTKVIDIAMLSLWGEVDDDITFDFEPLRSLDELQLADKRAKEADTDTKYIQEGVLRPEESRQRLADDPDSPYAGIDPDDPPDLAQEEQEGLNPPGVRRKEDGSVDPEGGEPAPAPGEEEEGGGRSGPPFGDGAVDAQPEFHEEDHPRAPDGKFGSGGGGGSSTPAAGAEATNPREYAAAKKALTTVGLADYKQSLTASERDQVEEIFGDVEAAYEYYRSDDFKDDAPAMFNQITGEFTEKIDRGRKMFESYRDQPGVSVAISEWGDLPHGQRETWIQLAENEHQREQKEKGYKDKLRGEISTTPGLSERGAKIEQDAREFAKKMKLDPSTVVVREDTREFTLNGKKMVAAGDANLNTGLIQIYSKHVGERTMYAVVAHEVIHQKFESLLNKKRTEYRAIQNMISASQSDANPDKVLRSGDVLKADGGLKPPFDAQFPLYHQVSELLNDRKRLEKSDGVSPYSTEYWVQYENDKSDWKFELAVHETLAEMASNRVQTGSRGAKAKVWKDLYQLMEESWPGGKSEPGWNKKIPQQEQRPT